MLIFEKRATVILYKILSALPKTGCFLLPANVCPIVVAAFLKAGIGYEFVDISPNTLCMDEATVLARLRHGVARYRGVLFVRTYGIAANFDAFFRAIKSISRDLLIIDDKCLCIPEFESRVPSVADAELYSTGAAKYVNIGWGGYAYAADTLPYCADALRRYDPNHLENVLSNIKISLSEHTMLSGFATDWLDGALPPIDFEPYKKTVLGELGRITGHKHRLNAIYRDNLPLHVQLPAGFHDWRFNIIVRNRDALLKTIFAQGLFAGTNYPSLAHIFAEGSAGVAEGLHSTVLNLFNEECFTAEQAVRIVDVIKAHLG